MANPLKAVTMATVTKLTYVASRLTTSSHWNNSSTCCCDIFLFVSLIHRSLHVFLAASSHISSNECKYLPFSTSSTCASNSSYFSPDVFNRTFSFLIQIWYFLTAFFISNRAALTSSFASSNTNFSFMANSGNIAARSILIALFIG